MKTIQVALCQRIATLLLVAVAVPSVGLAQEQEPVASTLAEPVREVRYVSDKLVLNVYAEPDQGSARVATIQTGDAVDELERSANMVRVRLDDGREGWVGSNYLTSDAPAVVRLRELQAERKQGSETNEADRKLTAENVTLKKENSALQARVSELQSASAAAAAAAPVAAVADAMPVGVTTTAEVVSTEAAPAAVTSSGPGPWGWTIVAAVLAGSLGYVSGYQALARRLRKKFGGLKLY